MASSSSCSRDELVRENSGKGKRPQDVIQTPKKHVFLPNRDDVVNTRFRLRYSSLCDSYYRDWNDSVDPQSRTVLTSWDRAVYTSDSVHRTVDAEHGEVYLDRTSYSCTGVIAWRFDFGRCGLCVDQITLQLSSHEGYGGEVSAMLLGNGGNKCVRYLGAGDPVTFGELENSTILTLSIHLIGESKRQITRLFSQGIFKGRNIEYPMDVKITLKHPVNTIGFPRVVLGLMYSNSQEIKVDKRHFRDNEICPGKGFLHIHVVKSVDLKANKIGPTEAYCKCLLLPDPKKSTRCRTNKGRKGPNPSWNEPFIVRNIPNEELKHRCLELWVYDWTLSLLRKNALIGGLRLSLGQDKWTENAKTYCSPRIADRKMFTFSTSRLLSPIKKFKNYNLSSDSEFSSNVSYISDGSNSRVHEIPDIVVLDAISECDSTEAEGDRVTSDVSKKTENMKELDDDSIINGSLKNYHEIDTDDSKEGKGQENGSHAILTDQQTTCKGLCNGNIPHLGSHGLGQEQDRLTGDDGPDAKDEVSEISCPNQSREWPGILKHRCLANSHSDGESAYSSCELEDAGSGNENEGVAPNVKPLSNNSDSDTFNMTENEGATGSSSKDSKDLETSKISQDIQLDTQPGLRAPRACEHDGDEDSGISSRDKNDNVNSAVDELGSLPSSNASRSVSRTSSLRTITRRFNFRIRNRTKSDSSASTVSSAIEDELGETNSAMLMDSQGLEIEQWEMMMERPREWIYCWHTLRTQMTSAYSAMSFAE